MTLLSVLVLLIAPPNLAGADSTIISPEQTDTLSSIGYKVSNVEAQVRAVQDSLRVLFKITQESKWTDIGIPVITAFIGFFSALLIYVLQQRSQKRQRDDTWQALAYALCKEAKESVERCCYLAECQALDIISRAPFPRAARQHLMDQLSAIAVDSAVMVELTGVYNILDRIVVHADNALDLEAKGFKEQALEAQGNGVAFILLYLPDMMKHLQNLKVSIDETFRRRQQFINQFRSSWPEFLVIAYAYSVTNDAIDLTRVLEKAGINDPIPFLRGMEAKQYLRIEITPSHLTQYALDNASVHLTQDVLEQVRFTTWKPI